MPQPRKNNIRALARSDCGTAYAVEIPFTHRGVTDTLHTFLDPETYTQLWEREASLTIRPRRGKPCVMVAFPGIPADYLARWVMGNPSRGLHVHHRLYEGKACTLINTAEGLQVLTPSQHMACHRAAEGLKHEQ